MVVTAVRRVITRNRVSRTSAVTFCVPYPRYENASIYQWKNLQKIAAHTAAQRHSSSYIAAQQARGGVDSSDTHAGNEDKCIGENK